MELRNALEDQRLRVANEPVSCDDAKRIVWRGEQGEGYLITAGSGEKLKNPSIKYLVLERFERNLSVNCQPIELQRALSHKFFSKVKSGDEIRVETFSSFSERRRTSPRSCRQRFCIAARFECLNSSASSVSSSDDACFRTMLSYGNVVAVVSARVSFKDEEGRDAQREELLVIVEWAEGLKEDMITGALITIKNFLLEEGMNFF